MSSMNLGNQGASARFEDLVRSSLEHDTFVNINSKLFLPDTVIIAVSLINLNYQHQFIAEHQCLEQQHQWSHPPKYQGKTEPCTPHPAQ